MKNVDVIELFSNRMTGKTKNLRSDGNFLVNYSTVLAQYDDGCIIVNMTKYSSSTSTIQNKLLSMLTYDFGSTYIEVVKDVPMNTSNLQNFERVLTKVVSA